MRYLILLTLLPIAALAADPRTECQQGPCKVLMLSPEEENVLVGKNGILDTAAAGRALDLGSLVSYFRTKIATAPAGDPKAVTAPAPAASPAPESSVAK